MAIKKAATNNMIYSFDVGNGKCAALSSEIRDVVQFEPVIAPLSDKRALSKADEKPNFSLQMDGQTLVFGVEDVFQHGKRAAIRRLNASERYGSPDYFRLIDVLYLHAFAAQRGLGGEFIRPSGVVSVPVEVFNNAAAVATINDTLAGRHTLVDYDGCELRIEIVPERLKIQPESSGALMHWAYDETLKKRNSTSGSTLVIDIGYETTHASLYEGMKYQRDRAVSIWRAGMGVVARQLADYARGAVRDVDVSRLDRGLRAVAGIKPGNAKCVEVAPGVQVDVTAAYDQALDELSAKIADDLTTHYRESVTRVVLAGGGAYHLLNHLQARLPWGDVHMVTDAELANVRGGYTALALMQAAKQ